MADSVRGLLSEISAHRDGQCTSTTPGCRTRFWVEAFVRYFLCVHDQEDDLVFFVHKCTRNSRYIPKIETWVEVLRRGSKRLPLAEPQVDWEETVYLNLIVQQVEYTVTCAICKRTSPDHLQLLRRRSQRVYASPSRHSMENKGEAEEMTYPTIFFTVDSYEEVFGDLWLRDGELVCIELVAHYHKRPGVEDSGKVLFLGSVGPEALRRSATGGRYAFVRLRGPRGKGHAQLALRDALQQSEQPWRRLSDPSLVAKGCQPPDLRKVRSHNEGVDLFGEVEAADLRDELDGSGWRQPLQYGGPIGIALTYVAISWHHIVADLLDTCRSPLLTF
ncbi:uncharacterized protein KIAA0930 homolog [Ornithodoros turicata]|uniref:uncharacterized protein KIAA0930 homolog n=1 Tax=Ornithodoros turicata TaxID=34597 RepID=UPI00313A1311